MPRNQETVPLRMGWQERRRGSWLLCPDCSWAFDKGWGKRLSVCPPIHRPVGPGLALPISNVTTGGSGRMRMCHL